MVSAFSKDLECLGLWSEQVCSSPHPFLVSDGKGKATGLTRIKQLGCSLNNFAPKFDLPYHKEGVGPQINLLCPSPKEAMEFQASWGVGVGGGWVEGGLIKDLVPLPQFDSRGVILGPSPTCHELGRGCL